MRGFVSAAFFAIVVTTLLAFAATTDIAFRRSNSKPVVIQAPLPAPAVEVKENSPYDEFGPDPTVKVTSAPKAQSIKTERKLEPPKIVVKRAKPKKVEEPTPWKQQKTVKKAAEKPKAKPIREGKRERRPKPTAVAVAKRERPKSQPAPKEEKPLIPTKPSEIDREQIERDREWRRKVIERWEREERERKKREREAAQRAIEDEMSRRGDG